jgi:hypothetical protein
VLLRAFPCAVGAPWRAHISHNEPLRTAAAGALPRTACRRGRALSARARRQRPPAACLSVCSDRSRKLRTGAGSAGGGSITAGESHVMKNEEKLRALLTVEAVLQGQMVKEFDEVVFSGRPGMLYGPVKTQFGYHLIVIKSLS